ncbi:hypothetical protein IFDJLNFL_5185 [Methylobacterium dankookense]|uniref:Uncharacterized protein n=1 Tax=Methylobacterium dankookense TaxID=560405 RepID=A0ABQ4RN83_9HYPH|nr:hypothetical protein IFDJLNFL_5185 [Methylobacterium dankookense]
MPGGYGRARPSIGRRACRCIPGARALGERAAVQYGKRHEEPRDRARNRSRHHPGRAAARREYRHDGPRHGEFRPVGAAPRQPEERLAEEGRARGGLGRHARARRGDDLCQRRGGHRRPEPRARHHRPRARPDEARVRARRGDGAGHRARGAAGRRDVRARAGRPVERRGLAGRRHRHLPGLAGLPLAQPRPERVARRLRVAARQRPGQDPLLRRDALAARDPRGPDLAVREP